MKERTTVLDKNSGGTREQPRSKKMKTNFNEKKIELTKSEMKLASIYGTPEYANLQAIRRDYPD